MARGRPKKEPSSQGTDSVFPVSESIVDYDPQNEPSTVPDTSEESPDMVAEMERILLQPKSKSAIPTFVTFREKDSIPLRHVIIDVPESYLREAWDIYREINEFPLAEDFLAFVNATLKKGVPRLYRVVASLDLTS